MKKICLIKPKSYKLEKKDEHSEEIFINSNDIEGTSTIESVGNKIYFYSEVDRSSVLSLNKHLRAIDDAIFLNSRTWNAKNKSPIIIYFNSYGGSLFDAFAAIDYIRNTSSPTYTIIDGCAASAATLMSVCGKKRFINRNAAMLIHQLSAWHGGTYEYLKDEQRNSRFMMKLIRSIYDEYTKIPSKKLNEILKRDIWLDARTCLRFGLVDEILP